MEEDIRLMQEALKEARAAAEEDEVPVGAVICYKGRIIARGHNMTERLCDPTAHAEMIALTAATQAVGGKYLNDCTIYVTVEPCPMCAGAIINTRLKRVVYGAFDENMGACASVTRLMDKNFGHKPLVRSRILEKECGEIMSEFFKKLR